MAGPLTGTRVLELARILAGPWAGQILADLGADVIKVERPGAGTIPAAGALRLSSAPTAASSDRPTIMPAIAGSVRLRSTLKPRPGGASRKLAQRSDVVIENFKAGGLAKFELDYASLAKENPRLIYCSITGFGQDGPYAHRAGYDLLVQGMGASWTLPACRKASRRAVGSPMPMSSPASTRWSAFSRPSSSATRPGTAATSTRRCSTRR